MKRFLPTLAFVLMSVMIMAQAPKGINYQGVARDNEGKPLASKNIAVRISILKTSATGEVEYSETHKPTTNQFGLFTLVIGQGTKVTGDFAFISWAVGNKWLQIEIDPNGGSTYTLAGSQQLMTVPYAFYAEYTGSGGLTAGNGIDITNGVISNTGDNDQANELQTLAEVLTKSNNAGTLKITNLGAPVAASDAATKSYVDEQNNLDLDKDPNNEIQDLSQVLTKGTDAGGKKITGLGTPTLANDAATKNYVDSKTLADALAKGNDAGAKQIKNLAAPTDANDAVTKNYVDTQNALDLDQSATNEIQTLTYTPATNNLAISSGNSVTISTNLNQVLTNSNDAGAKKITNLAAPTNDSDATTKLYVDNAIATNYAFKVPYSFTNSGTLVVNQVVSLGADIYDDFNVVASNQFVTPATGTYMFFVDGILSNTSITLELRVNSSTIYPVKKQEWRDQFGVVNFNNSLSLMLKLSKDDIVQIYITSSSTINTISGTFFGYKL